MLIFPLYVVPMNSTKSFLFCQQDPISTKKKFKQSNFSLPCSCFCPFFFQLHDELPRKTVRKEKDIKYPFLGCFSFFISEKKYTYMSGLDIMFLNLGREMT